MIFNSLVLGRYDSANVWFLVSVQAMEVTRDIEAMKIMKCLSAIDALATIGAIGGI